MTGGGSGIGHAAALAFAAEWIRVLIADRSESAGKSAAAEARRQHGAARQSR
jgi:NAD(P)-dependent dehydrogenase (short-subunit alcohol dehydrogenase family)